MFYWQGTRLKDGGLTAWLISFRARLGEGGKKNRISFLTFLVRRLFYLVSLGITYYFTSFVMDFFIFLGSTFRLVDLFFHAITRVITES